MIYVDIFHAIIQICYVEIMSSSQSRFFLDLSKLEPLDGTNYKQWSQKFLIACEQVELDYILFNDQLAKKDVVVPSSSTIIISETLVKRKP